jgi:hypothetical protein
MYDGDDMDKVEEGEKEGNDRWDPPLIERNIEGVRALVGCDTRPACWASGCFLTP